MLDFNLSFFLNLFLADDKVRREEASRAMQSHQVELHMFLLVYWCLQ